MVDKAPIELKWSKNYAIGHSAVDQQHAKLFELYNIIAEAFIAGLGHEVVEPALDELIAYTRFHFAEEEKLMERLKYADIAAHRRSHQRLLHDVTELADEFRDGKPVLLYELLSLTKSWLTDHIIHEDQLLREPLSKC